MRLRPRPFAILAVVLITIVRCLPLSARYPVLALASRRAAPLVGRVSRLRSKRVWKINRDGDILLEAILRRMEQKRVPYSAEVNFIGLETLREAAKQQQGTLIIAPHAMLLFLAIRRLHELVPGFVAVVAPTTESMGYAPEVAKIWRSPTFLLDVRDALRQGKSVFTMVDRPQSRLGMTTAVDTAAGTLHLADAAVRLGVRMGARIRFVTAVADPGGITCRLAAPTAAAEGETEAILSGFGEFVGAHATVAKARVAGGRNT